MPGTRRREATDAELDAAADRLGEIDLGDYWDMTRPADIEFADRLETNSVVVEPKLLNEVRARARKLGKTPEALVNEWLRTGLGAH